LIPSALLALGLVPIVAGVLRLSQLGVGAAITQENARFFATPLPVVVHVVSAALFSTFGALQFAPGLRLLAGSAMALCLCLGVAAVLRRDLPRHQAWMMRGYALGLGAGTQVFTHLPWFLFPSIQGAMTRAMCMAAGWAINLAVAEWLILELPAGIGHRLASRR
jgi:Predicted membrane protein (DUF2306)